MRDMVHLRQVHQASLVFAMENPDGAYPCPSWCAVPGHDVTMQDHTTASLYSMLIAQEYFTPDLIVGTAEVNENIEVDEDYDYSAYNPVGSSPSYWDRSFTADLERGSNASFAHQPMVGERFEQHWKTSTDPGRILFGTRGPREGDENDVNSTSPSLTHEMYEPKDTWIGSVVANDNSSRLIDTFYLVEAPHKNDNLFRVDLNTGGTGATTPHEATDFFLTFTRNVTVDADGNAVIDAQFD